MSRVGRARWTPMGTFIEAVDREALWPGELLLAGGVSGVLLAHGIAAWTTDLSAATGTGATAVLAIASLVALGIGADLVVVVAGSPLRHIFVSDSLRRISWSFVAVAGLLVAAPVLLSCFDDLALGHGITACVIAGIGMLGGAVAMVVIAGIAWWLSRRVSLDEEQQL